MRKEGGGKEDEEAGDLSMKLLLPPLPSRKTGLEGNEPTNGLGAHNPLGFNSFVARN